MLGGLRPPTRLDTAPLLDEARDYLDSWFPTARDLPQVGSVFVETMFPGDHRVYHAHEEDLYNRHPSVAFKEQLYGVLQRMSGPANGLAKPIRDTTYFQYQALREATIAIVDDVWLNATRDVARRRPDLEDRISKYFASYFVRRRPRPR